MLFRAFYKKLLRERGGTDRHTPNTLCNGFGSVRNWKRVSGRPCRHFLKSSPTQAACKYFSTTTVVETFSPLQGRFCVPFRTNPLRINDRSKMPLASNGWLYIYCSVVVLFVQGTMVPCTLLFILIVHSLVRKRKIGSVLLQGRGLVAKKETK